MIRNFASAETEQFFASGKSRRFPPEILKRAAMRLTQLDAATRIEDLRLPPSNRLEAECETRVAIRLPPLPLAGEGWGEGNGHDRFHCHAR